MKNNNSFWVVVSVVGLIWLKSGWGKLVAGNFAQTLGATLEKFAAKNPYPWFKDILTGFAIPNARLLGPLVMAGELAAGITLTAVGLYWLFNGKKNNPVVYLALFGFLVAATLSATFFLAAGWTSASTESLNLLLLAIEIIGLVAVGKMAFIGPRSS